MPWHAIWISLVHHASGAYADQICVRFLRSHAAYHLPSMDDAWIRSAPGLQHSREKSVETDSPNWPTTFTNHRCSSMHHHADSSVQLASTVSWHTYGSRPHVNASIQWTERWPSCWFCTGKVACDLSISHCATVMVSDSLQTCLSWAPCIEPGTTAIQVGADWQQR